MTAAQKIDVASDPAHALLELRGIGKTFHTDDIETRALSNVELAVRQGEFVSISGPSGSGKSTLLHVMGTLDRPSSGSVRIEGRDVAGLPDRALSALRAERIGFVFQQFFLMDGMTALENVAEGLLYRGVPRGARLAAARAALDRVGLAHRMTHVPSTLSGGERQRVAIARAIVGRPSFVLADEPTGNLDSARSAEIMDLLEELHGDGATIVVITHDHEVAATLPRTVVVRDGRVVA